jgi:hypothetical protein
MERLGDGSPPHTLFVVVPQESLEIVVVKVIGMVLRITSAGGRRQA